MKKLDKLIRENKAGAKGGDGMPTTRTEHLWIRSTENAWLEGVRGCNMLIHTAVYRSMKGTYPRETN